MCHTCQRLFPLLREFGNSHGIDLTPVRVGHFYPSYPYTVLLKFNPDLQWDSATMWEFLEAIYEIGIEHNPFLFDEIECTSYELMVRLKVYIHIKH